MGNFSIRNEGNRTLLVYALSEDQSIDSFSLGMLTENRIPGLAETSFTQVDAQKFVIYNITARIPARQLFTGPVNKQWILRVFEGITSALMSAEEYMIPFSSLMLDLDRIYCNVMNSETVLICLPLIDTPAQNDPNTFMKSILFNTQFDQSENCDYVTTLINYLNTHPTLQLVEFRRLLLEMERAPKEIKPTDSIPGGLPRKQPDAPKPVQQPDQQPVQQPVKPPMQQPIQRPVQQPVKPPVQRTAQPPVQPEEKPMSMLYLLQHYSKENKAIYDAQHKSTDEKGKKKTDKKKEKAEKKEKTGKVKKTASFQVPGMFEREEYRPGQIPASEIPAQPQQPIIQKPVIQQPVMQQPVPDPVRESSYAAVVPQNESADFGDTVYFADRAGGNDTVFMGMENTPAQRIGPFLMRIKNNERIPLDKPVFRLGRESGNGAYRKNDYVIADNPYVSNSHAVIISRNGEYFLIDSNSQNHSYLNGEQLLPGDEARLTHEARFALANEEFEFKLY